MITVDEARARAAAKVAQLGRAWAVNDAHTPRELRIALRPPGEREALAARSQVIAWRDAWASAGREPGVTVTWVQRSWASVGSQAVPTHATIIGADEIARFAGPDTAEAWTLLRDRVGAAVARLGVATAAAMRTNAATLMGYADAEFQTVLDVVEWLVANPVEGMRPRQLPIRGVDSKWFGGHRRVVSSLVLAASGRDDLGIVGDPQLVRLRLLDERVLPGAPRAFGASVDELASLSIRPGTVLVLENLESLMALPPLDEVVAVHGGGFAVAELQRVRWLRAARLLYWGDLDSNGFAILHQLRSGVPHVRSVLMDEGTLLAHRDLWVPEPTPVRGAYPTLEPVEQATLDRLRDEGDVRLEQERIPWEVALRELRRALGHRDANS